MRQPKYACPHFVVVTLVGQFEARSPNATHDRVCGSTGPCFEDEFESTPSTTPRHGRTGVHAASTINRTPSFLQGKKCCASFMLYVFEGPGYGLHVELNLRPPYQREQDKNVA